LPKAPEWVPARQTSRAFFKTPRLRRLLVRIAPQMLDLQGRFAALRKLRLGMQLSKKEQQG